LKEHILVMHKDENLSKATWTSILTLQPTKKINANNLK
jgi:hypothetical protein